MAVYTEVGDDELRAFAALYDLGEVLACKGIAEGVENSNYLLTTEHGNFILTLYEKRVAPEDLPFFIALMDHLAHQGVPCPPPLRARDGEALRQLCGRPAAIVTFLTGMWPRRIEPFHCAGLGSALAALHRAGGSFAGRRTNSLGVTGWRRLYEASAARAGELQQGLAAELGDELAFLEATWPQGFPSGVINADLFPDNILVRAHQVPVLTYSHIAVNAFLAYDLAIDANAQCLRQ